MTIDFGHEDEKPLRAQQLLLSIQFLLSLGSCSTQHKIKLSAINKAETEQKPGSLPHGGSQQVGGKGWAVAIARTICRPTLCQEAPVGIRPISQDAGGSSCFGIEGCWSAARFWQRGKHSSVSRVGSSSPLGACETGWKKCSM